MRKTFLFACFLFTGLIGSSYAQPQRVSLADEITILKAEDARRYDAKLDAFMRSTNEQTRARAALAAGRIGNDAALGLLTELLQKDTSVRVRTMAAFAIGEIESINSATDVVAAIEANKTQSAVTARLVEAAGKIAGANATDAKVEQLRNAILSVLESEHSKGAKQDRETVLLALTAALRAAPRDAKRERPDQTDIVVAKFLTNADRRVRSDAANTITRVRAKNASAVLRTMLDKDTYAIARANAARALGAAEDKDALNLLIEAMELDASQEVRVSAIRALAAIRDVKAADRLTVRAEALLEEYKRAAKSPGIPAQHNEFVEIATALGRLLVNTRNERAVNLFREFGKLDSGLTTEVYLARLRVAPGRGDDGKPELTHWRQYSTLGQIIGEFATLEVTTDESKTMKSEAPDILRPFAKAYAEADPVKDAVTIKAGPDVLRAFAAFKTADVSEVLRSALTNKDVFIRATAAELIGDQAASDENLTALNRALEYAIMNDVAYNDAVLATLDALFKLDKKKSVPAIALAAGSLDHLIRGRVLQMMSDDVFKDALPAELRNLNRNHLREVKPYGGKFTKLGQVLNTDADYRRALARKNGATSAVVTTQKGMFTIDLLPEDAPLTVDNFVKLARAGYFNGLEVHRVVPNFVMQDGDPRGDGNGGPGWSIRCELNMVPYERGVIGMALSGKDTGGSQWFATHSPQPHLDGGYTVFGRVNETGMKVVDKIVRGDKIVSIVIEEGSSTQRSRARRR